MLSLDNHIKGYPRGVEPTASTFTESRANPYTTDTIEITIDPPTGNRTRTSSLGPRRDFRFTIGVRRWVAELARAPRSSIAWEVLRLPLRRE